MRWRHRGCLHLLQKPSGGLDVCCNRNSCWRTRCAGAVAAACVRCATAAATLSAAALAPLLSHTLQWPPPGAQLSTAADTMRTTVPATSARRLAALRQESAALRQAPQVHFCQQQQRSPAKLPTAAPKQLLQLRQAPGAQLSTAAATAAAAAAKRQAHLLADALDRYCSCGSARLSPAGRAGRLVVCCMRDSCCCSCWIQA